MRRRSVVNLLLWAVLAGGIIAIFNGDQQAVSLRLWLAGVVVWFAAASVARLFEGLPLIPARLKTLFIAWWRRKPVAVDSRLRELRSLEGLILRSRDNNRAFAQQLQPRIVALADHFLAVNHGIDRQTQPDRVHELLGDLVWMLDPRSSHRSPSLEEVDDLVDRLTRPAGTPTKEAA